MGKIDKASVLYLEEPKAKGRYCCDQCMMWISGTARCEVHGPQDEIEEDGSCGLWVFGPSHKTGISGGQLTKEESGYTESDEGFSCARCQHFDRRPRRCDLVEGEIDPNGCCNAWEAAAYKLGDHRLSERAQEDLEKD